MKLIICDLDGTLLNDDGEVTENTVKTLKEVKERGYEIAIATGRSNNSAGKIREYVGIEMYLICNNGANIYNKDGSLLGINYMPKNLVRKVVEILDKAKVNYKGFREKDVYLPKYAVLHEEIREEHNVIFLEDFDILPDLEKILVIEEDEEKLFSAKELMHKYFDEELEIVISSEDCLDLNIKNCSKKLGVELISKELGISVEDIMAFGDSGNDYKMLKLVGQPVAMKDSYVSTKGFEEITYLTNEQDGVADYLKKKVLKI